VTWEEIEAGVRIDDFDLFNVPARVAALGDLWADVVAPDAGFDLAALLR
jgi:DNA primase